MLLTAMFKLLTGKNLRINHAGNSLAVDAQLLYIIYTNSRSSQKSTSLTVRCVEMNVI